MASEEMDPADLRRRWARSLDAALQADGWGQIVEALDAYERLGRMINSSIEGLRPDAAMRAMLNKTVLCVNMRAKALKSETEADAAAGPSIDQMKTLGPFIRALFTDEQEAFPFNVARLGGRGAAVELDSSAAGGKEEEEHRGGSLLPAPALRAGEQYISVEVEKWGLKDAETYVDPFVTVLVYDEDGKAMESPQDLPIAAEKKHPYVIFNKTVYLQTPIRQMRRENAAIFFEFKHIKPKKGNYTSTRCFCFMEMDEVKEGKIQLESYKKPTDPKRKKINLFTVKELYLHLKITLHSL